MKSQVVPQQNERQVIEVPCNSNGAEKSNLSLSSFSKDETVDEEQKYRSENSAAINPILELRPLLSFLKLSGLCLSDEIINNHSGRKTSKPWFVLRATIQVLFNCLLWLSFGRMVALFWIPGNFETTRIITTMVAFQASMQATVCFVSWMRVGSFQSSFVRFIKYLEDHPKELTSTIKTGYITKLLKVFFVTLIFFLLCNCILTSVLLPAKDNAFTKVFRDPLPNTLASSLLIVIILTPCMMIAFMVPVTFFILICWLILHQCENLKRKLQDNLEKNSLNNMQYLRRLHCVICEEISLADDVFTYTSMIFYVTMIPVLCFILFNFLFVSGHSEDFQISMTIWMAGFGTTLGLYSFSGALVNTKVHELIVYLQGLSVQSISKETLAELILFISKLNGQPVVFTAGRIVIIDNSLIVTVLGVILTYFALLYQMK